MYLLKRLLEYRLTLSLLLIVVLPISLWGALQSFLSISNRVVDWMPEDFQATKDFMRFFHLFGSDELLMISWEDCRLDDPRIDVYRDALLAPADTATGPQTLFRKVITGPDVLAMYRAAPLQMSRTEALEKMEGWLVSKDHQRTCLIALIKMPEVGDADRHAAVAHVRSAAGRVPGLSADAIHVAGSTIEGVAIDEASLARLMPLNLLCLAICLAIMACCLRSLRAAFVILLIALFNQQMSLALIHYCGTPMNSILLLTASLTFVLSISVCIHWFNYYRDALLECRPEEAPLAACRAALQPTALATLTTALGLVSLAVSRIRPTTQFGIYSAAALIIATCVAFVYISLHFRIWPLGSRPARATVRPPHLSLLGKLRSERSSVSGMEPPQLRNGRRDAHGWVGFMQFIQWPVIFATFTWLYFGYQGVTQLRTAVGLHELLPAGNRVVQDFAWLENRIGPLTPVEIVLRMPACDNNAMQGQYRTLAAVHAALAQKHPECAVISAVTFTPESRGGLRQVARAAAIRRVMLENKQELRTLGYLMPSAGEHHWRITMRAPAAGDVDFGTLLDGMRTTIQNTLGKQETQPDEVLVCGAIPLVYQAQQQLLEDLIYSFLTAFALVSLTLMLLFRSIWCGLICMIPNLLPSAIVFGYMGWSGMSIEFGTILTASAAMGIAVDDSLHFITWFRKRVSQGGTIGEAIAYAYQRCAAAMIQTSLICSLGLLVFALSPFAPISYFGWCMFALLLIALMADLVVLPCILLSPLGRPFLPAKPLQPAGSQEKQAYQQYRQPEPAWREP